MVTSKLRELVQISASLETRLGGPVSVVQDLARNLQNYFHHTLFVCGKNEFKYGNQIHMPSLFGNRFGLPYKFPSSSVRARLRSADVILIHGFFLFTTIMGIVLTRSQQIFLMPHGSLELYQDKRGRFRKTIFIWVFKRLLRQRKVHFLVGGVDEVLSVRDKFPNAQITTVRLGINPVDLVNSLPDPSPLKENPLTLLSFSRIASKKRIDLCIESLCQIKQMGIEATLYIAGVGKQSLVKQLKKQVRDLGIIQSVVWLGNVTGPQKLNIFRSADIFLLPSENENFAVAVAEAISAKVPVIVSSNVGMHYFVEEFKVGEVIESLDVDQIVKCVFRICNNRNFYLDNCEKNRHRLYWDFVINDWINTLNGGVE